MKHIGNNCDEWIVRNPVANGRTSQPVYCISTHGVPQRTVTKRRLLRSRLEVTLKRQKQNERSLSQPVTENRLAAQSLYIRRGGSISICRVIHSRLRLLFFGFFFLLHEEELLLQTSPVQSSSVFSARSQLYAAPVIQWTSRCNSDYSAKWY